MKIAVLVKQVPGAQSQLSLDANFRLDRSNADLVINPADLHAVEAAIRIAEGKNDATALISMGPSGIEQSTKRALAMGIDEAIHVTDAELEAADIWVTANVIAKTILKVNAELVFAGTKSTDGKSGAVPAYVAKLLGWDFAIVSNELELDLVLNLKKPTIAIIAEELNTPRLPNFKGIAAAKNKPITFFSVRDLGISDLVPKTKVLSISEIGKSREKQKLSGGVEESANVILQQISNWNEQSDSDSNFDVSALSSEVDVFEAHEIVEAAQLAAQKRCALITDVENIVDGKFVKQDFDGKVEVVVEAETPCVITLSQKKNANGLYIGVGGGVGNVENIQKLANQLDAEVIGTAAAIEKGFIEVSQLVGESGKHVKPFIYLNFGVSGAHHHMVGVQNAKYILSVNKDAEAEVFNSSDLFAVHDADSIVEAMLEELAK